MTKEHQRQVGGSHYKDMPNGYQVIDLVERLDLTYLEGNVLKYLVRYRRKHDKNPEKQIEDLEKARQYLQFLINEIRQNKEIAADVTETKSAILSQRFLIFRRKKNFERVQAATGHRRTDVSALRRSQ